MPQSADILFLALGWILIFRYPVITLFIAFAFIMEFFRCVFEEHQRLNNPAVASNKEESGPDPKEDAISEEVDSLSRSVGDEGVVRNESPEIHPPKFQIYDVNKADIVENSPTFD